jgi:hypothetical protein
MSDQEASMKPVDLANKLFDMAILQYRNDPREAARQCVIYLTEALVYAISSTAGDENARKALLKSVGETIINAPPLGKP